MTLVIGACVLVTIVALWALHFAASGRLLNRYVEAATDPIFAARRTVNGLLVSVAGLIAVAVGNELIIAHPQGHTSFPLSLLLFGGSLLYLLSQTSYLWACPRQRRVKSTRGAASVARSFRWSFHHALRGSREDVQADGALDVSCCNVNTACSMDSR
jgi:low temperature requirement protein LtrA